MCLSNNNFTNFSGPPEEPKSLKVVAMAATQANISWVVGLSGGTRLTFWVFYSVKGESQEHIQDREIVSPGYGNVQAYILTDLIPSTEYEVRVASRNQFQEGSNESESVNITLTTRGTVI